MQLRLGYLLIDGFALMSYAPVIEPFRAANRLSDRQLYTWRHYSPTGSPARVSNGLLLTVDAAISALDQVDILFVCAGGNPSLFDDGATFASLRRAARFGTIIAGVSGGPFVMARAGLLDGYRCTVHWEHEDSFRETFSKPQLERNLYVVDRKRITCAGGLAGLDLTTKLIAETHGTTLARKVSDWYIQSEQRQGDRPQRQAPLQVLGEAHVGLGRVLAAMDEDTSVPHDRLVLARLGGVSVRQLERLFAAKLGATISAHSLKLRLERARRLIVETDMTIADVSSASGFSSTSYFSRAFKQRFHQPPSGLRRIPRKT